MPGSWNRKSNLYSPDMICGLMRLRQVTFYYESDTIALIKSVCIYQARDDHKYYMILTLSPVRKKITLALAKEFFHVVEVGTNTRFARILIQQDNFLENLQKFFNSRPGLSEQYTKELKHEMREIADFMQNPTHCKQHIIPNAVKETYLPFSDPKKEDSKALANYLDMQRNDKDLFANTHKFLADGYDPNSENGSGMSCLLMLVMHYANNTTPAYFNTLKILVIYGAIIYKPAWYDQQSPYEQAHHTKCVATLKFFDTVLSQPRKEVTPVPQLLAVDVLAAHEKIVCAYHFPEGAIYTRLKRISAVSNEEKAALEEVFQQGFEEKLNHRVMFNDDANKYIQIIQHENGNIIGMVIYIVRYKQDKVWVNIDIEIFDKRYQNYGLMPTITYGFPLALQQLHKDKTVWIVFFGAHYASFRRIEGQRALPLVQPQGFAEEVDEVLRDDFGYEFKLHHENSLQFYVEENKPKRVRGEHQSQVPGLMEWLYQVLRTNDGSLPAHIVKQRHVLVALPVSFEFLKHLHGILLTRGSNFYSLVSILADNFKVSGLFDLPVKTRLYNKAAPLIFSREVIVEEESSHQQLAAHPQFKTTRARY